MNPENLHKVTWLTIYTTTRMHSKEGAEYNSAFFLLTYLEKRQIMKK